MHLVAATQAGKRVVETICEESAIGKVGERVVEGLARELVDALPVGCAQRGVLDDERSLERELVDEPALLVGPVPAFARFGADRRDRKAVRWRGGRKPRRSEAAAR